jgi:glycosyltransferase involved in cell wall biosynthesis
LRIEVVNYALTGSPLSRDYQQRLEELIGATPEYVRLSELRGLPLPQMLRELRTLRGERLLIPIEDDSSRAILPVLRGVAALTPTRRIDVVYPDFRIEPVYRSQIGGFFLSLASASLDARRQVQECRREMQHLKEAPRIKARLCESRHVLYANANLWFGVKAGGSVGHIAGVVNSLARRGYHVDYAAASPPYKPEANVTYHALQVPEVFGVPFELNYYRFGRDVVRQLAELAGEPPRAFVYQRMSIMNYSGVVLSRIAKIPLVLEYNGSEVWVAKNWGRPLRDPELAELAEEVSLKHAHLVVTISDVLRDELIERGVPAERIVTYPNCIDPQIFDPQRFSETENLELRARYNIAPDAVVGTFVGTFGQWHGVEVLAAAIRQLIDDDAEWLRRHKVHFLLVGDGLNMPKVREILEGDKYAPFHTLTGLVPQDQAPSHLAVSDFLLSPHAPNADGSRFFGSPTKLFEYMAMGKGIVASDLDQIGEVLSPSLAVGQLPPGGEPDAVNTSDAVAVLCRPGDVEELARGIRFVVEHPDWRRKLGENARGKALAHYTWDHHVAAILEGLQRQPD